MDVLGKLMSKVDADITAALTAKVHRAALPLLACVC